MDIEKINELLGKYHNKNDDRETIRYVMNVEWGGKKWYGATDTYQAILIPHQEDLVIPDPPIATVNIAGVMPEFDIEKYIEFEQLTFLYKRIPIVDVPVTKECPSCNGEGEFTHYTHTYSCLYCMGECEIETGDIVKEKDPKSLFGILGGHLKHKFIKNLLLVANEAKVDKIAIRRASPSKSTVFVVGEIIVLIMPVLPNSLEGFTIIEPEILAK